MRLLIEAADGALGGRGRPDRSARGRVRRRRLRVPDGELRPGLINAHDHLHRNHYGRLGAPPYANAYEWGRDIHRATPKRSRAAGRCRAARRCSPARGRTCSRGVTTVVHHDRWEPEFDRDFPLRVVRVRNGALAGLRAGAVRPSPPAAGRSPSISPKGWMRSRRKRCASSTALGLLAPDLLAVHGVGAGRRRHPPRCARPVRRSSGARARTSSSSAAPRPPRLLAPGIDVLLGSDSLLTADGVLLDELRAARELGLVSDARLARRGRRTAAQRSASTRRRSTSGRAPTSSCSAVRCSRRPRRTSRSSSPTGAPRRRPALVPALGALAALRAHRDRWTTCRGGSAISRRATGRTRAGRTIERQQTIAR